MDNLDDGIHERIKALCAAGDTANSYTDAIAHYEAAWDLLPAPKASWTAATWILAAIGDARYMSGEFERGRDTLLAAMHCPDAIGNPFLHLRLGQCQFELGSQTS